MARRTAKSGVQPASGNLRPTRWSLSTAPARVCLVISQISIASARLPWTSGYVQGIIDAPYLTLTPGTRLVSSTMPPWRAGRRSAATLAFENRPHVLETVLHETARPIEAHRGSPFLFRRC